MAEGKKKLYRLEYAKSVLSNVYKRACMVNNKTAEYEFPMYIKNMVLFGSVAKESSRVHDLDIGVELGVSPEFINNGKIDSNALENWYIEAFPSLSERYGCMIAFMPYDETLRWIKNRKGIVSFHTMQDVVKLQKEHPDDVFIDLIRDGVPVGEAYITDFCAA